MLQFNIPKPPKEARSIINILRKKVKPVREWSSTGSCVKHKGDVETRCPLGLHPLAVDSWPTTPKLFGVPSVKKKAVTKFYHWWDGLTDNLTDRTGKELPYPSITNEDRKRAYRRASYYIWPTKKGR